MKEKRAVYGILSNNKTATPASRIVTHKMKSSAPRSFFFWRIRHLHKHRRHPRKNEKKIEEVEEETGFVVSDKKNHKMRERRGIPPGSAILAVP